MNFTNHDTTCSFILVQGLDETTSFIDMHRY